MTTEEVLDATDYVVPALEIIDSRYEGTASTCEVWSQQLLIKPIRCWKSKCPPKSSTSAQAW